MKFKLLTAATILILLSSPGLVSGQPSPPGSNDFPSRVRKRIAELQRQTGAPAFDPTTGQSIQPPVVFDPTTGQPMYPPAPGSDWKDPNWKDPDIVLTNAVFRGLPLGEVASFLREHFKGEFDIILPPAQTEVFTVANGVVPTMDWVNNTLIELQLKDVTASELFNAMNLLFENDRIPLRWELKVNGHRQLALLRVLVDPIPIAPMPPKPEVRKVYFIGDLVGDEKTGGMTMEQIIKTITDVWKMTESTGGKIEFHQEAQLLVVQGSAEQVDFVLQTLIALRDKQHHAQAMARSDDSKGISPPVKK